MVRLLVRVVDGKDVRNGEARCDRKRADGGGAVGERRVEAGIGNARKPQPSQKLRTAERHEQGREYADEDEAPRLVAHVQLRNEVALHQHAERADEDRGDDKRGPVADGDIRIVEQEIGGERAHHILRAVGEIDDVEQAEDHREAEAQHGVERAVDEAEEQLAEQRLRGHAQKFEHRGNLRNSISRRSQAGSRPRRAA